MIDTATNGWVVLHRKLRRSVLWRSLRPDQKAVTVTLLLLANWKPGQGRWHGRPFPVDRGELFHDLETIAGEVGCSVKVVRTTIAVLLADDRDFGGNGPFLSEKYPILGTGPGTGPRVLRVEKYDEYQKVSIETGTASGTEPARTGHGPGTDQAEREPIQPDQPSEPGRAGGDEDPVALELLAAARERLRLDVRKVFDGVTGYRRGAVLWLVARDDFHRRKLEDLWTGFLVELLGELNHPLQLRFTTAARAAAGGA